jgi:UDP-N-acetylglucosamine transferase subunit ALG13
MIFVTVGTSRQPFTRLLRAIDELATDPAFRGESFFLQAGHGAFQAVHCEQKDFMPRDEFARMIASARVVVAHGGGGTLLQVFQAGKVPVAVPRRKRWDEAINDHQVDLVRELAAAGRVIPAYEVEDLPQALRAALSRNLDATPPGPSPMLRLVSAAVEELIGAPDKPPERA